MKSRYENIPHLYQMVGKWRRYPQLGAASSVVVAML
jgi:hypothetical protein